MILNNIIMLSKLNLNKKERKAIILASLGCVLEFYDFIILGFMSINFISDVFQGELSYHKNLVIFFIVLLFGYLVRPFGMFLYSKIAPVQETYILDAVVSIMFIIATCAIAFIPEHNYFLAIFILLLSRIMQGIASGAEMQSNIDHIFIKLPDKANYSIFGIISGNEMGIMLGILVNRILNLIFNQAQMINYGWRVTFIIAASICLAIYFIRYFYSDKVSEQHCYREITPLYRLIKHYPRQFFIAILFSGLRGSTTFLLLLVLPFFLYHNCGYSLAKTSHIMMSTSLIGFIFGYLINNFILYNSKVSYKTILNFMAILVVLSIPAIIFLCYTMIQKDNLIFSIIIATVITGCFRSIIPFLMMGLFPTDDLLAGFNFTNHLGFVLFGVMVIIFSAMLAYSIHLILPSIRFLDLYCSSIGFYIFIVSVLSVVGIRHLMDHIDAQMIAERRTLLLQHTTRHN